MRRKAGPEHSGSMVEKPVESLWKVCGKWTIRLEERGEEPEGRLNFPQAFHRLSTSFPHLILRQSPVPKGYVVSFPQFPQPLLRLLVVN